MGKPDNRPESAEESGGLISGALCVLNSLEAEGLIDRYAIGRSVALLFYVEPFFTEDLDVFCHLASPGALLSLAPIYEYLQKLGYHPDGQFISVEGILLQFLVPPALLVEEALENAVETQVEGVATRVFQYEYLLAIMTETNRPRDRVKLRLALDSADPDSAKLTDILSRYNLLEKWQQITA